MGPEREEGRGEWRLKQEARVISVTLMRETDTPIWIQHTPEGAEFKEQPVRRGRILYNSRIS